MKKHTTATLRTALIVLGVMLGAVVLTAGLVVVGLVWVASTVMVPRNTPDEPTRAVVTKSMAYDDARLVVSGSLERHYEWDNPSPIDVTVTANTPDGPADGCKVMIRREAKSPLFEIVLTDEQAVAFRHPEAKRTVSLRRADGQLVQAETAW